MLGGKVQVETENLITGNPEKTRDSGKEDQTIDGDMNKSRPYRLEFSSSPYAAGTSVSSSRVFPLASFYLVLSLTASSRHCTNSQHFVCGDFLSPL
jgi:hypothetical protein